MSMMQFIDRAAPFSLDPAIALLGNEPAGMALDFAARRAWVRDRVTGANNFLGDPGGILSITRASTAAYFDAMGTLRTAANNEARYDHDPVTGAPLGFLIEEQRTNLFLRSSDFGNVAWVKSSTTVLPNAALAPDGTMTASKLIESAVTANHYLTQSISYTTGQTYTASIFIKAGERSVARLLLTGLAPTVSAYFDLLSGTVASGSGSIQAVGDGWYRISVTTTATTTGSGTVAYLYTAETVAGGTNYAGDGVSGFYVSEAQLEVGAFTTSPIHTTSAQATRAGDLATVPASLFPYSATGGTIYFEASTMQPSSGYAAASDRAHVVGLNDTATQNQFEAFISAGGIYVVSRKDNGTLSSTLPPAGSTPAPHAVVKAAMGFAADTASISVAGAAAVDLGAKPVDLTDITQLVIGDSRITGGRQLNGHIKRLAYFPRRLSNTELQARTA